jgi:hypothetical protein
MALSYRPECMAGFKPVGGQLLMLIRQVLDREPQVVWVLQDREKLFRFLQADLPLGRLAGGLSDVLVHGVHNRPCEVRLGVRQATLIVCTGSLGQRKEPFTLKVWDQHRLLPAGTVLHKEPCKHAGKSNVLSR